MQAASEVECNFVHGTSLCWKVSPSEIFSFKQVTASNFGSCGNVCLGRKGKMYVGYQRFYHVYFCWTANSSAGLKHGVWKGEGHMLRLDGWADPRPGRAFVSQWEPLQGSNAQRRLQLKIWSSRERSWHRIILCLRHRQSWESLGKVSSPELEFQLHPYYLNSPELQFSHPPQPVRKSKSDDSHQTLNSTLWKC